MLANQDCICISTIDEILAILEFEIVFAEYSLSYASHLNQQLLASMHCSLMFDLSSSHQKHIHSC